MLSVLGSGVGVCFVFVFISALFCLMSRLFGVYGGCSGWCCLCVGSFDACLLSEYRARTWGVCIVCLGVREYSFLCDCCGMILLFEYCGCRAVRARMFGSVG